MGFFTHLLWVGEGVCSSVVCDGNVALLDVDVGSSILTHGAKLDQVRIRGKLLWVKWNRVA